MTRNSKFISAASFCLFSFSLITGLIGYLHFDLNMMTIGVYIALFANIFWAFSKLGNRIVFLFFNLMIFLFLLGRQFIRIFDNTVWWRDSFEITAAATFLIYLSLVSLFVGAAVTDTIYNQKIKKSHSPPPASVSPLLTSENSKYLHYLQNISLLLFVLCFICKMILEMDKFSFMQGKDYYAYYTEYSSGNVSSYVRILANSYLYALCIFLATMPKKHKAFVPLILYLISTVPTLLIGIRNPFMLAIFFIFLYYFARDTINKNLPDKKKWIGKIEKIFVIILIPILLSAMAAINYSRDNVDISLSFTGIISDLLVKQGVSFFTICSGLLVLGILPLTNINYTFGPFIEYLTRSTLAQQILLTHELRPNTVEKALYANSFADTVSYLTRSDYLQGHGSGSSYIIELFVDFGYLGVILGSILFGVLLIYLIPSMKKGWLLRSMVLMALTGILFVPRGSATSWLLFITNAQYWGLVIISTLLAKLLLKKYGLPLRNTKKTEVKGMFEKYGFMDFFSAVWMKKFLIAAVIVAFGVAGLAYNLAGTILSSNEKTPESKVSELAIVYLAPTSTYFTDQDVNGRNSILDFNNTMPSTYISVLGTEPCFAYTYQRLESKFTPEQLTSAGVHAEGVNIYELVTFESKSPSPAIKISCTSTIANQDIAKEIVLSMVEYAKNEIPKKMSYATVSQVDIFEGDLLPDLKKPAPVLSKTNIRSIVQNAVAFSIVGFILSVAYVFMISLFKPTINRKSDFYSYNLPIFGELE